jgi:penicillin-binding protein 1A
MKKQNYKQLLRKAGYAVLIGIGIILLFIGSVFVGVFGHLQSTEELAAIQQENASVVYSEDGEIIGKYFAKNRTQVDSADIPHYILDALVATEDKRFYAHNGVDLKSYFRVIFKTLMMGDKGSGGGSTITQQLAKNLYGRGSFSFLSFPVNKTREAILARRLEKVYTKHQILVLYLNTVPFGENTYGIEAASSRYFNISAKQLNENQGALLVGMLKGNTIFSPRLHPEEALERRNLVFTLMEEQGYITAEQATEFRARDLQLDYTNYEWYNPCGYFVERVEGEVQRILKDIEDETGQHYDLEKDGLEVFTTLNFALQEFALESVKKQLLIVQPILRKELAESYLHKKWMRDNPALFEDTTKANRYVFKWEDSGKNSLSKADSAWMAYTLLHAGVLAMHPATGEVKVYIGGNNSRFLPYDLVMAERQSASSFKPIVYAAALEAGYDPCTYLSNESRIFTEYNNWQPHNYDNSSGGEVAMWYALSKSMNLPTVDLYMKTGHEQVRKTATALGLYLPSKALPSYALGTTSNSLYQMAQAYSAFATRGYVPVPKLITEIKDKDGNVIYTAESPKRKKVLADHTAVDMTKMLETAITSGTGIRLKTTYGIQSALAGKTGTSQNYSDAWFLSYNQNLVFGVWVGAMSPQVHFRSGTYGSGSALALPIAGNFWRDVERNKALRRQFAVGFRRDSTYSSYFDCDGEYDPNFFEEILDNISGKSASSGRDSDNDEDEPGWAKRTWQKVFKK